MGTIFDMSNNSVMYGMTEKSQNKPKYNKSDSLILQEEGEKNECYNDHTCPW